MNGNNFLFDTNALINFLAGNANLKAYSQTNITLSIFSVIEFLSFQNLKKADHKLFLDFINEIEVVDLTRSNQLLINIITEIRSFYKLKLPDAIIAAATVIFKNAELVTSDKHFSKIILLKILSY